MAQNPSNAPSGMGPSVTGTVPSIEKVASGQKTIIAGIMCYLCAIVMQLVVGPAAGIVGLAMVVLGVIGIVRIGSGLGYTTVAKVFMALSLFIPVVGLIVLVIINSKATKALRENGYTVGLLGASK